METRLPEVRSCKALFRRRNRRRGLTLLEVMLSIGLIVIMSSMMFMFYERVLAERDRGLAAIQKTHLLRAIAMKMADEIRSANGFLSGLGAGIGGDGDLLKLQTVKIADKEVMYRRQATDRPLPGQSDIRQVWYYLAYDEDEKFTYPDGVESFKPLGLVRREIKTLNQTPQDEEQGLDLDLDLLAPEVKYLRLRYFDGVDWVDKWEIADGPEAMMGNSLPQAVEITVGYPPKPPPIDEQANLEDDKLGSNLAPSEAETYSPDTFTMTVFLNQADRFFGSRLMRAQRQASSGLGGGDSGG